MCSTLVVIEPGVGSVKWSRVGLPGNAVIGNTNGPPIRIESYQRAVQAAFVIPAFGWAWTWFRPYPKNLDQPIETSPKKVSYSIIKPEVGLSPWIIIPVQNGTKLEGRVRVVCLKLFRAYPGPGLRYPGIVPVSNTQYTYIYRFPTCWVCSYIDNNSTIPSHYNYTQ